METGVALYRVQRRSGGRTRSYTLSDDRSTMTAITSNLSKLRNLKLKSNLNLPRSLPLPTPQYDDDTPVYVFRPRRPPPAPPSTKSLNENGTRPSKLPHRVNHPRDHSLQIRSTDEVHPRVLAGGGTVYRIDNRGYPRDFRANTHPMLQLQLQPPAPPNPTRLSKLSKIINPFHRLGGPDILIDGPREHRGQRGALPSHIRVPDPNPNPNPLLPTFTKAIHALHAAKTILSRNRPTHPDPRCVEWIRLPFIDTTGYVQRGRLTCRPGGNLLRSTLRRNAFRAAGKRTSTSDG